MNASLAKTIITKAKRLFEKSGMTLDELGQKMGNDSATARQAAWQLFNKTPDPRLSTIEKLAEALGVTVKDLF
jgi:transcriptional regulator with XRE-family HTH domain